MRLPIQIDLSDNGFVELESSYIRYWEDEGEATYEGKLSEFNKHYPKQWEELINLNVVTPV